MPWVGGEVVSTDRLQRQRGGEGVCTDRLQHQVGGEGVYCISADRLEHQVGGEGEAKWTIVLCGDGVLMYRLWSIV